MYINKGQIISRDRYRVYETDGLTCYYTPIIFTKDTKAGEDTVLYLVNKYIEEGKIDFIEFFGAFKIIIEDKKKNEIIIFSDNSNQRCFYTYKEQISDSFYTLIKNNEDIKFSYENVVEYLYFGKNFFHRTYIEGLDRLSYEKYCVFKNGKLSIEDKNIGNLNDSSLAIDAYGFSKILKGNLTNSEEKKGISLTGGFDSRYVLAMIDSPFIDATIYSSVEDYPDSRVSKKICQTLDKQFNLVLIGEPKVMEEDIVNLLYNQDLYMGFFGGVDFSYKMPRFLKELKSQEYTCLFTGDTGVHHKDEHWQEEILNYSNPKTNTSKFFNNRIKPIYSKEAYTEKGLKTLDKKIDNILLWLEENKQEINTKSMDWYSWYLDRSAFVPSYYNTKSKNLEVYAPLLEYRFLINSYNQKRSDRRFAKYMINFISNTIPEIAKIPTILGTNTSKRARDKFRNTYYTTKNIFVKGIRLFNRKVFKKQSFNFVDNWSLDGFIRKSKLCKEALDFGISNELVNEKAPSFDYASLSRLVEIYVVSKEISKN